MPRILFSAACVAALSLLACTPAGKTPVKPAAGAPHFQLENIAGGETSSDELRGKVSVVDIWATWCEPCITEIPKFNRLQEHFKDKDVRIIGLTDASPHDDIAPRSRELGIKYTVLVGNDSVVEDFGGVVGWPTTYVLTKDWKIYKKYIGALPNKEERIRADIEALLQ